MSTLNYETPPGSDDVRPLLAPALLMFFIGTFGPPALMSMIKVNALLASIIVCQCAAIAVAIVFASRNRDGFRMIGLERSGLRRSLKTILVGFIALGSITYLTNFVTLTLLRHFDALPDRNHPMLEIMRDGSTIQITLAILSAVLVAPVFEEILFRGHFQSMLSQLLGTVGSILLTSLLFTILHPWWTMPAIFVLSVLLCVVRWKANSTWATLCIHVLFNFTSTVLFLISHR